jgi:hypothetical protein
MSGAAKPNFMMIGSDIAGGAMTSPMATVTMKIKPVKTVFFMLALLSCFLTGLTGLIEFFGLWRDALRPKALLSW